MEIYDINGVNILPNDVTFLDNIGAIGDGVTDDSDAIQIALAKKGLIVGGVGKTYLVTRVLRIYEDTTLDLNGSTIVSTNNHLFFNFLDTDTSFTGYNGKGNICIKNGIIQGGAISFAHGENISLENIQFMNSLNDHFLEIAGCKSYRINRCSFVGMGNWTTSVLEYINLDHCRYNNFPWLPSGSTFYDMTANKTLNVSNCKFSVGEDDYAYGYNALGVHSTTGMTTNHEDITVNNCEIYGFTGCGIRLNGMNDIYINNNRIETVGNGIVIGDVASCDGIVVKNNYVVSSSGSKLVKTSGRYTNLTVVGNSTEGTIEDF